MKGLAKVLFTTFPHLFAVTLGLHSFTYLSVDNVYVRVNYQNLTIVISYKNASFVYS